jgi:hypothetical protein
MLINYSKVAQLPIPAKLEHKTRGMYPEQRHPEPVLSGIQTPPKTTHWAGVHRRGVPEFNLQRLILAPVFEKALRAPY